MSVLVIKGIKRYNCGLFNSCCGMKIIFLAYVLGLNKMCCVNEESFDNDFVEFFG